MEEEIKRLVILRLESWPKDVKIALGSGEELTRDELIEHVKEEDELGQEIIDMQLKYLRSMKTAFSEE